MTKPFADRLATAVRERGTPTLVGLDPRFEQLPAGFQANIAHEDWGAKVMACRDFCCDVIDVVAPLVAAVKPQSAFFELRPQGVAALGGVIAHARKRGLLVVLDGKRNDVGSTAEAYAQAYLGPYDAGSCRCDALTVSPYLGDDSLTPFVDACRQRGTGIFVLVKTSNPGSGMLQDLVADGKPIYRHVADYVERLSAAERGESGYGPIGAVVGATYPQQLAELRGAMPSAWLLIPGFGSQGGTARDVAAAFDERGLGGIVNNSRGIIFAHASQRYGHFGDARWQEAVAAATRDMIDELAAETSAGRLRTAGGNMRS